MSLEIETDLCLEWKLVFAFLTSSLWNYRTEVFTVQQIDN